MQIDVWRKYIVTGRTGLPNTTTTAPNVSHLNCFRKKQMSEDLAGLPTATNGLLNQSNSRGNSNFCHDKIKNPKK